MKLIFVYNAASGSINALLDAAHKIVSPQTYQCELCDLTHGVLKERGVWMRFRESAEVPMLFLHKDEFLKTYRSKWLPKYHFPVILAETDRGLEIAVSKEKFKDIKTPEELISEIQKVIEVF